MIYMGVGQDNYVNICRVEREIFVGLYAAVFFIIKAAIYQYFILANLEQMHASGNLPGRPVYG
jgi:hypothetical protein